MHRKKSAFLKNPRILLHVLPCASSEKSPTQGPSLSPALSSLCCYSYPLIQARKTPSVKSKAQPRNASTTVCIAQNRFQASFPSRRKTFMLHKIPYCSRHPTEGWEHSPHNIRAHFAALGIPLTLTVAGSCRQSQDT